MNGKGIWLNFLVALTLLGLLGSTLWLLVEGRGGVRCGAIEVVVEDSAAVHFVEAARVMEWLDSAGIRVEGARLAELDLMRIRRVIEQQPYVAGARVHATMQGVVSVVVRQHSPQIRIMSEKGYNFYADTLGHIIPTHGHAPHNVPLVTGKLKFSFDPAFFGTLDPKKSGDDVEYLKKLINFVQFIEKDPFLRGLVAQVYILSDRSVELWGRTAGQVVEVGELDDWAQKLRKTADFFRSAPRPVAAGRRCRLVVKYKDQIIVKYDG